MATAELQHKLLGPITVNTRQNTHRISAKWQNGMVCLNVPQGVGMPDLQRVLDDLAPRLLSVRPEISYADGQRLHFPMVDFVIRRQRFFPNRILGTAAVPTSAVEVGSDFDFRLADTSRAISDMLCKVARKVAPQVLVPHARALATETCHGPTGWVISTGHRILGQCSSKGVISLSYLLVFLPQRLCDYVICHELAHLTEMNHSPRFHRLLDGYLHGQEKQLIKELHSYRWPVFRK